MQLFSISDLIINHLHDTTIIDRLLQHRNAHAAHHNSQPLQQHFVPQYTIRSPDLSRPLDPRSAHHTSLLGHSAHHQSRKTFFLTPYRDLDSHATLGAVCHPYLTGHFAACNTLAV